MGPHHHALHAMLLCYAIQAMSCDLINELTQRLSFFGAAKPDKPYIIVLIIKLPFTICVVCCHVYYG
jgi:hypothetical protein